MKNHYSRVSLVLAMVCLFGMGRVHSQAFSTPLIIPELLDSTHYEIYADVENHDFGDGIHTNVATWAYNHAVSGTNSYLGPTLTWEVGRVQTHNIINRLGGTNTTTVHWHGANIPASQDGGPHQWFVPGDTFKVKFPVLDAPANLWYHPHADNTTYTGVQMGLAGMIIVRDPLDPVAPLLPKQYGVDDIPLIIQDLHFDDSIPNVYSIDTVQQDPRTAIVNGTIQPVLNVPPQVVRFRILNGSTRISYYLKIKNDSSSTDNRVVPFSLIGSDGGYLPDSARTLNSFYTGPGIRNEILVDLTNYADSTLWLVNDANLFSAAPFSGKVVGAGQNARPVNPIFMKIVVGSTPVGTQGIIPPALPAITPLGNTSNIRQIAMNGQSGNPGNPAPVPDSLKFNINNRQYVYETIDDTVNLGDIEEWVITNNSVVAHPFHIHLVQFFVTSVRDTGSTVELPIPAELLGPKDNILVPSGQVYTFKAIFDSYGTPMPFDVDTCTYMYHCHILTHEDGYYVGVGAGGQQQGNIPVTITDRDHWGMMQQFVVWNGVVNRDFSQPLGANLTLFPNPASDEIKLNGESSKMGILRIFDLQGKLLMEKLIPPFNGTISIDVANLPRGMVAVEMTSPEGKFTKKVVIAR